MLGCITASNDRDRLQPAQCSLCRVQLVAAAVLATGTLNINDYHEIGRGGFCLMNVECYMLVRRVIWCLVDKGKHTEPWAASAIQVQVTTVTAAVQGIWNFARQLWRGSKKKTEGFLCDGKVVRSLTLGAVFHVPRHSSEYSVTFMWNNTTHNLLVLNWKYEHNSHPRVRQPSSQIPHDHPSGTRSQSSIWLSRFPAVPGLPRFCLQKYSFPPSDNPLISSGEMHEECSEPPWRNGKSQAEGLIGHDNGAGRWEVIFMKFG